MEPWDEFAHRQTHSTLIRVCTSMVPLTPNPTIEKYLEESDELNGLAKRQPRRRGRNAVYAHAASLSVRQDNNVRQSPHVDTRLAHHRSSPSPSLSPSTHVRAS
eukprot:7389369-Prymnesium_polylepis.1